MQTININYINPKKGAKLLDLGCGEGRHCFGAYMHSDLDVFGFDMSKEDVQKALNNFEEFNENSPSKSCSFGVTDARKLPFSDNSFDYVICSEVLEHIIEFEEVISEINRILKPGGTFAASVPKFFPEWICWKLSKAYQEMPGGHVRIFKYKDFKKSILDRGFSFKKRHWNHALHSPYWWLQCLLWDTKEKSYIIKKYHDFLVWDMMKKPFLTKMLEFILQPIIAKSVVAYFKKK
ncbi:MAG: class I SAM-dependent methyltransferase [Gammaproteobacteria bacterium]